MWNGIQETMNALLLSGSNPGNYLDYSYAQDYEIFKKQELFKSMKMSQAVISNRYSTKLVTEL